MTKMRLRMRRIQEAVDFFYRFRFLFLFGRGRVQRRIRHRKILFWPYLPHHRSIAYKICRHLGLRVVRNPPSKHHLAVYWEDSTVAPSQDASPLTNKAINFVCQDISKTRVNQVFKQVFGYDLGIDPLKHKGRCVIKSNLNAQHDGRIIQCPVKKRRPDVIYQRLVDNRCSPRQVRDIRVPIVGPAIPFVYYTACSVF